MALELGCSVNRSLHFNLKLELIELKYRDTTPGAQQTDQFSNLFDQQFFVIFKLLPFQVIFWSVSLVFFCVFQTIHIQMMCLLYSDRAHCYSSFVQVNFLFIFFSLRSPVAICCFYLDIIFTDTPRTHTSMTLKRPINAYYFGWFVVFYLYILIFYENNSLLWLW